MLRRHAGRLLLPLLLCCVACAPLPREPLDLSDPEQLTRALELRAGGPGGRHIILFGLHAAPTSTEPSAGAATAAADLSMMWFLLAQNLVLHLATTQGGAYDHYIAITSTAATCRLLHERWPLGAVTTPSCAFSTAPYNVTRDYSAAGLCIGRYDVLSRVAERGYDTLLIDADVLFNGDLYALLDAPPLASYTAVVLRESPVNSGTVFVRGTKAHRAGGVLWVMREVTRRTVLLARARDAGGAGQPGFVYDQGILGFALRVAQHNLSEWDWSAHYKHVSDSSRQHPFWQDHPQPAASPGFQWMHTTATYSMPNASCPVHDAAACARYAAFLREQRLVNTPVSYTPVCTPPDSPYYDATVPCESLAAGPGWLWAHGLFASHGWREASAAVHLLAIEKTWHPTMLGSHAGRFAVTVAQGLFDPRLMPMPAEPPPLTPPAPAWTAAVSESYDMATRAIVAAFDAALAAKQPAVLHEIPCNARWIQRSNLSRSGILDWRIVETPDGRCWPAQAGYDSCFVHKHFLWPFQLVHARDSLLLRPPLDDAAVARARYPQWVIGYKP